MTKSPIKLPLPVFDDPRHHIRLYQGDSLELLALLPESSVDLIFADPPMALELLRLYGATKTSSAQRGQLAMTNREALNAVLEIIRENRENGELEGILNRRRIAALNRLILIARGEKSRGPKKIHRKRRRHASV
jgi:DNA modification methylase